MKMNIKTFRFNSIATVGSLLTVSLLTGLLLTSPATAQRRPRPQMQQDAVVWEGSVDNVTDIYFQQNRVWTRRISGHGGSSEARFSSPIPRRNVRLYLDERMGRGTVSIRQQPNRNNDFTGVVRVEDRPSGARRYKFALNW
jgi:outer membrane biogenesis lipoprotein LolB